jgi:hypothetical protein
MAATSDMLEQWREQHQSGFNARFNGHAENDPAQAGLASFPKRKHSNSGVSLK